MTRISDKFRNKKALIVFIMAGDPTLVATEKLVCDIEDAGADIIEIGIPFSDSIADGPTIQASAIRALNKNVSSADAIALVKKLRKKTSIPIAFMTSFNILFSYGLQKFLKDSKAAGVDGLIIPDLPLEEANKIQYKGLDHIFLVAPNSSNERIEMAAKRSQGFIYMVSLTGTTGARKSLPLDIKAIIGKLRRLTDLPVAIGFGISNPKQAREAAKIADGIIVGSAVINVIAKKGNVGKFVSSLKKAIS